MFSIAYTLATNSFAQEGVRTDSGIVYAQRRPFAMSVMIAYDGDERATECAFGDVALEPYHYFEMRGKASECGRILPLP